MLVCVIIITIKEAHNYVGEHILDTLVSFVILQQIKRELLDSQRKVSSLQELSAQLLVNTKPQAVLLQSQAADEVRAQSSECLEAQEKVHVIWNRLRLLLREVSGDLEGLERRLETMDTRQVCTFTFVTLLCHDNISCSVLLYLNTNIILTVFELRASFYLFCRTPQFCLLLTSHASLDQQAPCQRQLPKVANDW